MVHQICGADVVFVGVAGRDGYDATNGFIDDYDVGSFPHVVDETGAIWQNFEIVSQPSFIFLDVTGESERHIGALGIVGITERVERLLSN